jgi:hypothetical protein
MNRVFVAYTVEALLCGGPITVAAAYGLPWLMLGPLLMFPQSPFVAAKSFLWIIGCVLALIEFWRLAVATVTNRAFSFNSVFWLGIAGAIFSVTEVSAWSESLLVMTACIAPAICALHFAYLQYRKVRK